MGLRAVLQPVIAVASAAALTGCLFSETVETFTGPTMGSTYSIKYVRTADAPAPDALQQQVEALLAEIDRQVSTYRRDSLIEAFNDGPAGCQPMPEPVLEMARYGLELSERSEGPSTSPWNRCSTCGASAPGRVASGCPRPRRSPPCASSTATG